MCAYRPSTYCVLCPQRRYGVAGGGGRDHIRLMDIKQCVLETGVAKRGKENQVTGSGEEKYIEAET